MKFNIGERVQGVDHESRKARVLGMREGGYHVFTYQIASSQAKPIFLKNSGLRVIPTDVFETFYEREGTRNEKRKTPD